MAKNSNYTEKHGRGYRFVKRLADKHRAIVGLEEVRILKLPLLAKSEDQAIAQAKNINNSLELLETITSQDKSRRFTTLEYEQATDALLLVNKFDLSLWLEAKEGTSLQDKTFTQLAKSILNEILDAYRYKGSFSYYGDYLCKLFDSGVGAKPNLSEVLQRYFLKPRGTKQAWTRKNIADVTRYVTLFEETTGATAFSRITRKEVDKYIEDRSTVVKPSSIQREINAIRAVWTYASDKFDHNGKNPFSRPELPPSIEKRRPSANLADSRKLLKLLRESDPTSTTILLELILLTGARLGEVYGILQSDIVDAKNLFHIRPNTTRRLKNNSTIRVLPLTDRIKELLALYLDGKQHSTSNSASASCVKYLKAKGFLFTPHGLRHGMRDRLDELSVRHSDIEKLLGWTNQSFVSYYGSGDLTDQQRDALMNVEKYLLKSE